MRLDYQIVQNASPPTLLAGSASGVTAYCLHNTGQQHFGIPLR